MCAILPKNEEGRPLLLEPHSRFFLRHEIQFRLLRNRGLALPLISADDTLDALTVLQEAVDAGNSDMALRNEDVVSLTMVTSDADMAVLLFRRSDPDAATPTFENRRTRRIRLADKGEDEAVALSCHLFVHLDPIRREPLTYRAILGSARFRKNLCSRIDRGNSPTDKM
jgi:hypothetical protein